MFLANQIIDEDFFENTAQYGPDNDGPSPKAI